MPEHCNEVTPYCNEVEGRAIANTFAHYIRQLRDEPKANTCDARSERNGIFFGNEKI